MFVKNCIHPLVISFYGKHISLEGRQFRAQMAASQFDKELRDPDSFSLLLYPQCMALPKITL